MLLCDEKRPFLPILACAKVSRGRKERCHEENGQGGPSPQAPSSKLARILEACRARSHLAAYEPVRQPIDRSPVALVHQAHTPVLDRYGLVDPGAADRAVSRGFRAAFLHVLSTPSVRENLSGIDPSDSTDGHGGVYRLLALPASDHSEARGCVLDLVWLDGLRGGRFAGGRPPDKTQRETPGQSRSRQDSSAVVDHSTDSSSHQDDVGLAARPGQQQRTHASARDDSVLACIESVGGRHGIRGLRPVVATVQREGDVPDSLRWKHHAAGRGYPSANRTPGRMSLRLSLAEKPTPTPTSVLAADPSQARWQASLFAHQCTGIAASFASYGRRTLPRPLGNRSGIPRTQTNAGPPKGVVQDTGSRCHGIGRQHSCARTVAVVCRVGDGRESNPTEPGRSLASHSLGDGAGPQWHVLLHARRKTDGGGVRRLCTPLVEASSRLATQEKRPTSRVSKIAQAEGTRKNQNLWSL